MDTEEREVHPLKTYQLICFTPSGRLMLSKDVQPQKAAFGSSGVEGGMLTVLREVQMNDAAWNCDVGKLATVLEGAVVYAHYAIRHGIFALLRCGTLAKNLAFVGEQDTVLDIEPRV